MKRRRRLIATKTQTDGTSNNGVSNSSVRMLGSSANSANTIGMNETNGPNANGMSSEMVKTKVTETSTAMTVAATGAKFAAAGTKARHQADLRSR